MSGRICIFPLWFNIRFHFKSNPNLVLVLKCFTLRIFNWWFLNLWCNLHGAFGKFKCPIFKFQLIDRMICTSNRLMSNQWAFNSWMTMQNKPFEKYSWTLCLPWVMLREKKSMNNHAWKVRIPGIVCLSRMSQVWHVSPWAMKILSNLQCIGESSKNLCCMK